LIDYPRELKGAFIMKGSKVGIGPAFGTTFTSSTTA
jgi:hypothetical protein